jgi:hypothetical protein
MAERPKFFADLFARLQSMRAKLGRPHWLLVDEAHHLWPVEAGHVEMVVPMRLGEVILVTVHPRELAAALLPMVDVSIAVGPRPDDTFAQVAEALKVAPPRTTARLVRGEVATWFRHDSNDAMRLKVVRGRSTRLRHLRKYAEGNLGEKGFVFRGPEGRLRLRAQNLVTFMDLADGVDEETWLFHLRAGDYSRWIGTTVKDPDLAREVRAIERTSDASPTTSRRAIRDAIELRYTLPG